MNDESERARSSFILYSARPVPMLARRLAQRSTPLVRTLSATERSPGARLSLPWAIPLRRRRKRKTPPRLQAELRHRIRCRAEDSWDGQSRLAAVMPILHCCTRWPVPYGRRGSTRASRGLPPFWPVRTCQSEGRQKGWREFTNRNRRMDRWVRPFKLNGLGSPSY